MDRDSVLRSRDNCCLHPSCRSFLSHLFGSCWKAGADHHELLVLLSKAVLVTLVSYVTLNNGVEITQLGPGERKGPAVTVSWVKTNVSCRVTYSSSLSQTLPGPEKASISRAFPGVLKQSKVYFPCLGNYNKQGLKCKYKIKYCIAFPGLGSETGPFLNPAL